jgi:hypothetical protein
VNQADFLELIESKREGLKEIFSMSDGDPVNLMTDLLLNQDQQGKVIDANSDQIAMLKTSIDMLQETCSSLQSLVISQADAMSKLRFITEQGNEEQKEANTRQSEKLEQVEKFSRGGGEKGNATTVAGKLRFASIAAKVKTNNNFNKLQSMEMPLQLKIEEDDEDDDDDDDDETDWGDHEISEESIEDLGTQVQAAKMQQRRQSRLAQAGQRSPHPLTRAGMGVSSRKSRFFRTKKSPGATQRRMY